LFCLCKSTVRRTLPARTLNSSTTLISTGLFFFAPFILSEKTSTVR
jgi:hypothetical protein